MWGSSHFFGKLIVSSQKGIDVIRSNFILSVLLYVFCLPASAEDIWYQPSMGKQVSLDYEKMYLSENTAFTRRAISRTQVYMISKKLWTNKKRRSFFMARVVPQLRAANVTIAINTPGAVWMRCRPEAQLRGVLESELATIKSIEASTGLKVTHLALQSILSKPLPRTNGKIALGNCRSDSDYDLDDRGNDVATYIRNIKPRHRGLKIGVIDALLAQSSQDGVVSYNDAYSKLYSRLDSENLKLDFVLVDHPYEYTEIAGVDDGTTMMEFKRLTNFLRYRNVQSGLIVTAAIRKPTISPQGVDLSMQTFKARSNRYLTRVLRAQAGFDFYMQTSWYEPIKYDRPQLELLIDFSDTLDGSYLHYKRCTPEQYLADSPSLMDSARFRNDPLAHFMLAGRYNNRCMPVR